MKNPFVFALALLLLSAAAPPAHGVETFRAVLAPPVGVQSTAHGTAEFVLDGTETEITFTIAYEDLSSPEIAAHVHDAQGNIIFHLPAGPTKSGIWQNPGPIAVFQLRSQLLFVLVHSEQYPQGEIRGDLLVPVRSEPTSWGAVKSLFTPRP